MEFVFATHNANKLSEAKKIFSTHTIYGLSDLGLQMECEEDGQTFLENALKKALCIKKMTNLPVLSDDSGICISYYNDFPGIYSNRFLGKNISPELKNAYILQDMAHVPKEKRTAYFVCEAVFALDNDRNITARGILPGRIAFEAKGEHGFGYDPIFYVDAYQKTCAELDPALKNKISHRGMALSSIWKMLNAIEIKQ